MNFFEHCTVTAKLRRFSSCDGEDSVSTEYACDNEDFKYYFNGVLYANGSCPGNKGNVSIIFEVTREKFRPLTHPVAFSCVASVIDASGNNRFPQSLALDLDYPHNEEKLFFFEKGFGFDKFLKRRTLLRDSPELLPDDCLTLCLEIDFEISNDIIENFWKHDTDGMDFKDGHWYLRMDSEFGRDLCKMSTVFRDLMECTIVESGPDRIPIPQEEHRSFQFIYGFLGKFTLSGTLSSIRDLYILADKYDMQPIVQLCHRLLISVMRAMNTQRKLESVYKDMHVISELAERFEDDGRLGEILAVYSEIKKIRKARFHAFHDSNARQLRIGWNCEYRKDSFLFFVFRRNESIRLRTDTHT